jgi:hypothetical protein
VKVLDLTAATRDLMAPVCRDCIWWQSARPDAPVSRPSWERETEDEAGFFGRALVDGDDVIGWLQAAPERMTTRARTLPAGPPSPDAWLLLCAYFYDEEYLAGFQRLLLDVEAALKLRCVPAIEAFALRRSGADDRFRGYLREVNLFNAEVLEGGGFRTVARCGDVARYRLDLTTVVATPRRSRSVERVKTPAAAQPV